MSNTVWHVPLKQITPFVFKIFTPQGHGTGFQVHLATRGTLCGIATAFHVIKHAYEWEEPIKILHFDSGETVLLKEKDRVIYTWPKNDLAIIVFLKKDLPLKKGAIELIEKKTVKQGHDIGWCGFPSVQPDKLCFFSGHISCKLDKAYLVDGVAIHGVSGGPAFYMRTVNSKKPRICGIMTEYNPNYATGIPLPGVSRVSSVEPYLDTVKYLISLDQAKEDLEKKKMKSEKDEKLKKKPKEKKNIKKTTKKKSVKKITRKIK